MTGIGLAAERFALTLRGLRAADRFAVGRRLLSVIALGLLGEGGERGAWRTLRSHLHDHAMGDVRQTLLKLAHAVEMSEPTLAGVFSEVLVPDALHSRSLAETLAISSAVLSEIDPDADRTAFAAWFSDSLDEVVSSGPVVGELATSRTIAQLLVSLADLSPGQSVYDPCCGMGGLLTSSLLAAPGLQITGRDIHPISWALTRLRLTLLGADATIELGDSLDFGSRHPKAYDRILCDPPFGPYQESRQAIFGHAASLNLGRKLDSLFVAHCAESLTPSGRAVVLVNQSFLTRKGFEERLRHHLARSGLLEGVVALPAGIVPWTYAELAILVLSEGRAEDRGVKMVDAGPLLTGHRARARLAPEHLAALLAAYASEKDTLLGASISREDIVASGHYRPAQYFQAKVDRRPIADLLADAEHYEQLAAEEARHIDRLLLELKLREV